MSSTGWSCDKCTLNNIDSETSCAVCGAPKSNAPPIKQPKPQEKDDKYRELEKQYEELQKKKKNKKESKTLKPKPEFTNELKPTVLRAAYKNYTQNNAKQKPIPATNDNIENKSNSDSDSSDDDVQECCFIDNKFNEIQEYKLNEKDFSEWSINKIIKSIEFDQLIQTKTKELNENSSMWKFLKIKYPKNNDYLDDYNDLRQSSIEILHKLQYCDAQLIEAMSFDEISAIHLYTTDAVFRKLNESLRSNKDEWAPYCGPLLSGLSKLPFAWNTVYRGQNYEAHKIENKYQSGRIIRWDGFSSTSTDIERAKNFAGQNGYLFEIENGYHGRAISKFSKFPQEGEIMFNISSHFMIIDRYYDKKDKMLIIKMKELPFPWDSRAILWVDDNPKNNKNLMQKIEKKGIMMVPRISTQSALEFLDFMNHAFKQTDFDQFRIITDMHRFEYKDDDINGHKMEDKQAGITLIQELRKRKYNNKVMIYTSKIDISLSHCRKRGVYDEDKVIVTNQSKIVEQFGSFN